MDAIARHFSLRNSDRQKLHEIGRKRKKNEIPLSRDGSIFLIHNHKARIGLKF